MSDSILYVGTILGSVCGLIYLGVAVAFLAILLYEIFKSAFKRIKEIFETKRLFRYNIYREDVIHQLQTMLILVVILIPFIFGGVYLIAIVGTGDLTPLLK